MDRKSPNDSYVRPSNNFKHQGNHVVEHHWTYACLLTVITTECTSIYLGEKHAPVEDIGNISVNPVIIPFVKTQMDSAVKYGLKENL